MEVELKGAHGVEVGADGRRVPIAEIRNRGLMAVGRKLAAERAQDEREGRTHRPLNPVEQRALTLATAGAIADQPQPAAPLPAADHTSAPDPPPAAAAAPPADDAEGRARTEMLRQRIQLERAASGR